MTSHSKENLASYPGLELVASCTRNKRFYHSATAEEPVSLFKTLFFRSSRTEENVWLRRVELKNCERVNQISQNKNTVRVALFMGKRGYQQESDIIVLK